MSGSGGQGVITASILLGEAACIKEKLNTVQTQSYGPEARGGATRADVVISSEEIRYPKVINPHLLVALTQEAYNKYSKLVRPGGVLLTDKKFVEIDNKIDAKQVQLPMYNSVIEKIGKPVVFNVCMLGAVCNIIEIVKMGSILKTISDKLSVNKVEMNQEALKLGYNLCELHMTKEKNNFNKH